MIRSHVVYLHYKRGGSIGLIDPKVQFCSNKLGYFRASSRLSPFSLGWKNWPVEEFMYQLNHFCLILTNLTLITFTSKIDLMISLFIFLNYYAIK